jgi:hypothetical protein
MSSQLFEVLYDNITNKIIVKCRSNGYKTYKTILSDELLNTFNYDGIFKDFKIRLLKMLKNYIDIKNEKTIKIITIKDDMLSNKVDIILDKTKGTNIKIIDDYLMTLHYGSDNIDEQEYMIENYYTKTSINTKNIYFNFNIYYWNKLGSLFDELTDKDAMTENIKTNYDVCIKNINEMKTDLIYSSRYITLENNNFKSLRTYYRNTNFRDLLKLVNLETLVIFDNDVSELSYIKELKKLKTIMLVGLKKLKNISFINDIDTVENVYIGYCYKIKQEEINKLNSKIKVKFI